MSEGGVVCLLLRAVWWGRTAHRVVTGGGGAGGGEEGGGGGKGGRGGTVQQEYDLILHHDVHSRGHVQWSVRQTDCPRTLPCPASLTPPPCCGFLVGLWVGGRYYFSLSNTVAGQSVRLNILNMSKFESLYAEGMRPVLFSQTLAARKQGGRGWHRCGTGIKYYPTNLKHYLRLAGSGAGPPTARGTSLYTLSFTLVLPASSDVCFLAYCYPYTYTDLHRHLHQLQRTAAASGCLRRSLLCRTLAGNQCDVLTITSPSSSLSRMQQRPAVVLTGRVHPGESNASWVMQGAIDFLVSDHPKAKVGSSVSHTHTHRQRASHTGSQPHAGRQAARRESHTRPVSPPRSLAWRAVCPPVRQALRERYVFKVVPMLNPDGVVNGNYRTSLAGADLNRRWDAPDPLLHPTIHHTKKLIQVSETSDRASLCRPPGLGVAWLCADAGGLAMVG